MSRLLPGGCCTNDCGLRNAEHYERFAPNYLLWTKVKKLSKPPSLSLQILSFRNPKLPWPALPLKTLLQKALPLQKIFGATHHISVVVS